MLKEMAAIPPEAKPSAVNNKPYSGQATPEAEPSPSKIDLDMLTMILWEAKELYLKLNPQSCL